MTGSRKRIARDSLRQPGAQLALREPVCRLIMALETSEQQRVQLMPRAVALIDWWWIPKQLEEAHGDRAKSRKTLTSINMAAANLSELIGSLDPQYGREDRTRFHRSTIWLQNRRQRVRARQGQTRRIRHGVGRSYRCKLHLRPAASGAEADHGIRRAARTRTTTTRFA